MTNENKTQQLKDFLYFQQNLKKTALGIKLGKKLFTDPKSITSAQIIEAFKALGLNIPPEIEITVEVAQILVSGQAAYQAYQAGENLENVVNPTVGAINTLTQLGSQLHWFNDQDGDIATNVQIGSDIAMIIASGGTNVFSYVDLALTAYRQDLTNEIKAQQIAANGLISTIKNIYNRETPSFGQNFADLQNGKIGILGMLSKNCLLAPYTFASLLKNSNTLQEKFSFLNLDAIPTVSENYTYTASSYTTFLGMGRFYGHSATYSQMIQRIPYLKDENEARQFIFNILILPHIDSYKKAHEYYFNHKKFIYNHVSIETLAIAFGLGFDIGYISPDRDYSNIFETVNITPFEFGENIIQNYYSTFDYSGRTLVEAAIEFEHKNLITSKDQKRIEQYKIEDQKKILAQKIKKLDSLGYKQVSQIPKVRELLKQQTTFEEIPIQKDSISSRKFIVSNEWRKLQNYTTALQYLELVQKDPYFFNWESDILAQFNFMGTLDNFKTKFNNIFNLSLCRNINALAKGNIAYFLETDPKNIKNKNKEQGAGVF